MKTTKEPKPKSNRQPAARAKASPRARPKTGAKRETAAAGPALPPDIHQACEHARRIEAELIERHGLTTAQALRLLITHRLIECLSEPTTTLRDALQVKLMTLREDKVEEAMRLTENAELSEEDRISQIRAIFGR